MAYQRASWHSGLTYRNTCPQCKAITEYTDEALDFRPWYADGFVYCGRCNAPLRHNEGLAINNPAMHRVVIGEAPRSLAKFCTVCGNKFLDADKFCRECGMRRN